MQRAAQQLQKWPAARGRRCGSAAPRPDRRRSARRAGRHCRPRRPVRRPTRPAPSNPASGPRGPTTATSRPGPCCRVGVNSSTSRCVSDWRPKNTAASSGANGSRPGYGDRRGSPAKESAGSNPAERSPASSRTNPVSASVRSVHCTSVRSGIAIPGCSRSGNTGRLGDRARLSSAKHQRESTEASLARKTTASVFRSLAYSSRSQLRPAGMPCCHGHALPRAHRQQVDLEPGEGGQDVEEHLAHGVARVVARAAERQLHSPSHRAHGGECLVQSGPAPIGTGQSPVEVEPLPPWTPSTAGVACPLEDRPARRPAPRLPRRRRCSCRPDRLGKHRTWSQHPFVWRSRSSRADSDTRRSPCGDNLDRLLSRRTGDGRDEPDRLLRDRLSRP